eukprot:CAMPEP_0177656154 /NCGR_PEP_ID=MMETSP0447-20121125/15391_1 /TAXON_ID=0 /ORGANISM="Stygamoeba regulata, Strain BSH-02190019" /LENGTH=310 /DNA_ID=CAMNT_0019160205 /DNA_START=51 /DNA_END=983 /DNA_ORIENTATION=-
MFCLLCDFLLFLFLTIGLMVAYVVVKWKYLTPKKHDPAFVKNRFGGWAVITGASSGIGKVFAEVLASEGNNVVLVARREEVLKAIAADLEKKHGVQTRVVVADLGKREGPYTIVEAVKDLDVGLLVNNAGAGWFGYVLNQEPKDIEQILQLNATSMAVLTRLFLESMRRRSSEKRCGIIITSSSGGLGPVPGSTVYAAAKAFASNFALGVWMEESSRPGNKIDLCVVEPGPVETGFRGVASQGTEKYDSKGDSVGPEMTVELALAHLQAGHPVCLSDHYAYQAGVASKLLSRQQFARMAWGRFKRFVEKK